MYHSYPAITKFVSVQELFDWVYVQFVVILGPWEGGGGEVQNDLITEQIYAQG